MKAIKLFIILTFHIHLAISQCNFSTNWEPASWPSPNNKIQDIVVYNNQLYACGDFTHIGSVLANYIAKYNGTAWSTFPITQDSILTIKKMFVFNNELYFCLIRGNGDGRRDKIKKWNGSSWSTLSINSDSTFEFNSMCVFNGQLVIAASKMQYPYNQGSAVFIYNGGSSWTQLGQTTGSHYTRAMCEYNGSLYAGGFGNGLAKWNGTTWVDVAGIVNDYPFIKTMVVYNNELYASGCIKNMDGMITNCLVKYNGSNWQNVVVTGGANGIGGLGNPGHIMSFIVDGQNLICASTDGIWDNLATCRYNVFKFDGIQWGPVGGAICASGTGSCPSQTQGFPEGWWLENVNNMVKYGNDLFVVGGAGVNSWCLHIPPNSGYTISFSFAKLSNFFVTGVDETINKNEYSVYPNPVSDFLNLEIPTDQIKLIYFYDNYGRIINTPEISSRIDISFFSSGVYQLIIMTKDKKTIRKKIVKL